MQRVRHSLVAHGTCFIRNECKGNGRVVDCLEFLEDCANPNASLLDMLPRVWVKVGVQNRELGRSFLLPSDYKSANYGKLLLFIF